MDTQGSGANCQKDRASQQELNIPMDQTVRDILTLSFTGRCARVSVTKMPSPSILTLSWAVAGAQTPSHLRNLCHGGDQAKQLRTDSIEPARELSAFIAKASGSKS